MYKKVLVACTFSSVLASGWSQTLYASGWPSNAPTAQSAIYKVASPSSSPTAQAAQQTTQSITDLAISATGIGYFIADDDAFGTQDDHLFQFNLTNGSATDIGAIAGRGNINGLGADGIGRLFMVGYLDTHVYQLNPLNASYTIFATSSVEVNGDIAVSPDNQFAYMGTSFFQGDVWLTRLNLATHEFTLLGPTGMGSILAGLAFVGPDLYAIDSVNNGVGQPSLFLMNTTTGAGTRIASIAGAESLGGNGLASQPVPEPATLAVLLPGLCIAALRRRHARNLSY